LPASEKLQALSNLKVDLKVVRQWKKELGRTCRPKILPGNLLHSKLAE
jgi:hypothetical protein